MYLLVVADPIGDPSLSHWYSNLNGVPAPVQVPVEHTSVRPSAGVPEIAGGTESWGGRMATDTSVLAATMSAGPFFAVTLHESLWPSSPCSTVYVLPVPA